LADIERQNGQTCGDADNKLDGLSRIKNK